MVLSKSTRKGLSILSRKIAQKVIIVKPKKKRRGPKITRSILSNKPVTVSMRYVDLIVLDPGAGAIVSDQFRCHDIFQPMVGGGGTSHQPLTRDQWALSYNQFRVLKSKIKVTPVPLTISNTVPGMYGVCIRPTTTLGYASGQSIIEDPRNKNSWGLTAFNTLQHPRGNISVNRTYNVKTLEHEVRFDAHDQGSSITDNLANTRYFHVWYDSIGTPDAGSATFQIEMEYIVELSDPALVAQS